jgi:hypothetical protein
LRSLYCCAEKPNMRSQLLEIAFFYSSSCEFTTLVVYRMCNEDPPGE